jgi:GT2 family glycosyltransferase
MSHSGSGVAVVIPTHRRPVLLAACLRSVAGQTSLPAEVLVVDDVGDEHSREAVEEVSREEALEIRYVRGRTAGASASRNLGATLCRSPIIAFLDDDDCWEPDFLASCVAVLDDDASADMVLTWIRCLRDGVTVELRSLREGLAPEAFVGVNPGVTASNLCIRREAFESVDGFDETFPGSQDLDLLVRLRSRGTHYRVVPSALLRLRIHAGERITRTPDSRARGRWLLYEKHRELLSPIQRALTWTWAMSLQPPTDLTPVERMGRRIGLVVVPLRRRLVRRGMPHRRP